VAVLESHVEPGEEHDRRRGRMEQLVAELRERTTLVSLGGGEKAVERHRSRGKLTARERINGLVDPGSAFLELSALAAWDVYEGQAPPLGSSPASGSSRAESASSSPTMRRSRAAPTSR